MTVRFLPEAEHELRYAASYYENKQMGLGTGFIAEVEQTLSLIGAFPNLGTLITETERRMLIGKFPFEIIYCHSEGSIDVYAVKHLKRKPGYWKSRN